MKKKVKKHAHTAPKKTKAPVFVSMRFFVIGTSVAALLVAFVFMNKSAVRQSVQGVSIVKGMYNEGMVSWRPVAGAISYNIYYGEVTDPKNFKFNHSVRQIPASATSYTIQYLKKNMSYKYEVTAVGVDIHGNQTETWFSGILPLTNIQSM